VQTGVDEDRAGAGVADEERRNRNHVRLAAAEQRSQQLQGEEAPARVDHHRLREVDVAGDQRFDDDSRSRRPPGERLVQGLRLHLNLHPS
jgi:hypothetical protein